MIRIAVILTMAVAASIGACAGVPCMLAAAEQRANGETVYHCTFTGNLNPNGFPNDWTREQSPGFPRYLEIRVEPGSLAPDDRSLRMDLDGGAAAVYSPQFPASAGFNYVIESMVRTESLVHDHAYISVAFYDVAGKLLERCISTSIRGTTNWTRLRLGPLSPSNPATHHAVIGLHLEPVDGADLRGTAWFADVSAGRLPKLSLTVGHSNRLFLLPEQPEVVCRASGIADPKAAVIFQLLDADGRELQQSRMLIEPEGDNSGNERDGFTGHVSWRPALPNVGFYRTRCWLHGDDQISAPEMTLALIRSEPQPGYGEFGWTLPPTNQSPSLDSLGDFIDQAGINWLKLPVWDAAGDPKRCEWLAKFAERMQTRGVTVVGMLADPPAEVRKQFDPGDPLVAAQLFSAKPEAWFPSLEPLLIHTAQSVRWWQLGGDGDFSFVNFAGTKDTLTAVRNQFGGLGLKAQLGSSWPASLGISSGANDFNFIALSDAPFHSALEPATVAGPSAAKTRHWMFVNPSAGEQSATERAANLAKQMIAAKLENADAIFAANVVSTQRGLINNDGTASELFIPWRTTSLALAGSQPIGSLQLPHGSMNHIFQRDHEFVMATWNDQPCDEQVSLGEKASQMNVWGARLHSRRDDQNRPLVRADTSPSFITGLDEPLIRWQMAVGLAQSQWPTAFGDPLPNSIRVTNTFEQPVSGTVRCVLPEKWRMAPRELAFKLPAGESASLPFEVLLPLDASSGPQPVRFDFDLTSNQRYQFTVFRTIEIGDRKVYAEMTTRLDDSGDLVVEQKLTNTTDQPLSFRCSLFAPDRRRMTTQVPDLGRGVDVKTFRLADGKSLIGKTLWMHAEDSTGQRILNYRFVAQP